MSATFTCTKFNKSRAEHGTILMVQVWICGFLVYFLVVSGQ